MLIKYNLYLIVYENRQYHRVLTCKFVNKQYYTIYVEYTNYDFFRFFIKSKINNKDFFICYNKDKKALMSYSAVNFFVHKNQTIYENKTRKFRKLLNKHINFLRRQIQDI